MIDPRVTEVPLPRALHERDDFADEPVRKPRREPYRRPEQREMVRASLLGYDHDVYRNRRTKP
jgi:hypothetical protein